MEWKLIVWYRVYSSSLDDFKLFLESIKPTRAYPVVEHTRATVRAGTKLLISQVQNFDYDIAVTTYRGGAVLFLNYLYRLLYQPLCFRTHLIFYISFSSMDS